MFSHFKWGLLLFSLHISAVSFSQTIHVVQANGKPVINGVGDEWGNIPPYRIPLKQSDPQGKTNVAEVIIKAATFEDSVYIYSEWKDSTLSLTHKPFIWSDKKGRYETGPQREDRIAIQFAMSGKYNTNWLSGDEFVADMWHWKAFRSNPLGLAHDKMTVVSKSKMSGSLKVNTAGGAIYIKRLSDKGDDLYTSTRYGAKIDNIMPKYKFAESPQGSSTDIKAKGIWQNGVWRVEMSRLLNTGNPDDVVFRLGESVLGGIAIFDQTSDQDHVISEVLTFKFCLQIPCNT